MNQGKNDDLRAVRGLLWALVLAIPFYVVLVGIGYVAWRVIT